MLWGVKLCPLQQSRKSFAPGLDAKDMDLNPFIFGRKILVCLQASKCYGTRGGGVEKRRRKENAEKLNRWKFTFLTSHPPQSKKKLTEIPYAYCCPTLQKKFSGPHVFSLSRNFAAASFIHLLLSGSFTGQRQPALTSLETKGAAFDWFSMFSS